MAEQNQVGFVSVFREIFGNSSVTAQFLVSVGSVTTLLPCLGGRFEAGVSSMRWLNLFLELSGIGGGQLADKVFADECGGAVFNGLEITEEG